MMIPIEDKIRTVRKSALLLARKMFEMEKEDALYMWDEIIIYLRQRELGENTMEYEKLLSPGDEKEMKVEIKEKKKKKFAIDEDIVKEVSNALQAFIEHIDSDCASSGCMCDLRGEVCSQRIRKVLHDFESRLRLLESSQKEEKTVERT